MNSKNQLNPESEYKNVQIHKTEPKNIVRIPVHYKQPYAKASIPQFHNGPLYSVPIQVRSSLL